MSLETSAREPRTRLIVICVNYFNNEETLRYIQSLFRQQQSELIQVIVVDNSNTLKDADFRALPDRIVSNSFVFHPEDNLGYLNGAAWGLDQYLASQPMPEWIVVSNTDIDFPDFLFFEKLFTYYPNGLSGVVAPTIILERDKSSQNPYRILRPTKAKIRFYTIMFHYYYIAVAFQLLEKIKKKLTVFIEGKLHKSAAFYHPVPIYAPHGSLMIFYRSYFDGGALRYDAFLYNEEMFIAESLRQLGQQVIYDPRLSVIHREHATTSLINNREKIRYHKQSLAYVYKKYFRS